MNAATVVAELKTVIETLTSFAEHSPRASVETAQEPLPNTGIYRLVVIGTGKDYQCQELRFVDLILVLVNPLSGGNGNKSNIEAATLAEDIITTLDSTRSATYTVKPELDAQITRENGRMVISLAFRVEYEYEGV